MNTNLEIANAVAGNFILIDLTVRKWSGKTVDRKATDDTLQLNHAAKGSGKFIKEAMAGANKELRQCSADFDAIRTYLYTNSMPFSASAGINKGARMVSTRRSIEVLAGINQRVTTASSSVNDLLAVYDNRRTEAMRNLGDLANPLDYPTTDELKELFSVHVDVLPVPQNSDFSRTTIPTSIAEQLGERLVNQQRAIMESATKDLKARVLSEVQRIAKQLSKYGEGEKTRLHKTLVDNIKGLVEILEDSNVGSQPEITKLAEDIRESLCVHSIAKIKSSPTLAASVARKAEKIAIDIDNVQWF